MRLAGSLLVALALAACGRSSPQADALDNAAAQADPAAAAVMRNEASRMREDGGDASLASPDAPAQHAMAAAGAAAARSGPMPADKPAFGTAELVTPTDRGATPARPGSDTRGAQPHRAGDPVPNTDRPTPVANHY